VTLLLRKDLGEVSVVFTASLLTLVSNLLTIFRTEVRTGTWSPRADSFGTYSSTYLVCERRISTDRSVAYKRWQQAGWPEKSAFLLVDRLLVLAGKFKVVAMQGVIERLASALEVERVPSRLPRLTNGRSRCAPRQAPHGTVARCESSVAVALHQCRQRAPIVAVLHPTTSTLATTTPVSSSAEADTPSSGHLVNLPARR
jgi:hypothetical protein